MVSGGLITIINYGPNGDFGPSPEVGMFLLMTGADFLLMSGGDLLLQSL